MGINGVARSLALRPHHHEKQNHEAPYKHRLDEASAGIAGPDPIRGCTKNRRESAPLPPVGGRLARATRKANIHDLQGAGNQSEYAILVEAMKRFARWKLYAARVRADMSCADLSAEVLNRCGVEISPSTISRWECDNGQPRLDLYLATCETLGLGPDGLLENDES